ncbi:hypothetical protein [Aliarcobacter skirrowii]|uniref:hypothetical protein n=1 Tax=Aliarcobacter skirrowii TaxID=28200 RepID=UPI0029B6E22F|nr:hypothetical protein [Aliarcobacter skirrowii]MDX4037697.1 hypothetical protein [Aliarcobacter skirrowii]
MKKTNDFIKFIKRWLISNYDKFNYKPYLVRDLKSRGTYKLKFSSIPNIEIDISADTDYKFDLYIVLTYENQFYFSNPLDLTTVIKKDKKRYFCNLCIEKVYFKTKKEIWENHLKELIYWANENIKPKNEIVLTFYDGSYDIEILAKDSKNDRENSRCFSLFT